MPVRNRKAVITLLTDFGSLYPALMKGVILQFLESQTDVTFVDITHDIPHQNIVAGAFALQAAVPYFPKGSIHLAVVDPGVGTSRRCLVVESGGHFFVGPDNGLLIPAARSIGELKAYEIDVPLESSATFHGRDVFAPATADLANGKEIEKMGPLVTPMNLDVPKPRKVPGGIEATVMYIDYFGNVITNLETLPNCPVSLKGIPLKRVKTYANADLIEPLITKGSHGFGEIAINQGSAAERFSLMPKDRIILEEETCSE